MNKLPIIIDTDPGIDDFLCIALGCVYHDKLDLRAVTTIGGNHRTAITTRNALDIVSLFGRPEVPVARGSDSFLCEPFGRPATKFHGENGIGNVTLPHSTRPLDPLPAWDKLYESAKALNGELVLVPVAPLTNLALALQKHPDLPRYIKRIVLMGGSLDHGNISPFAEANIGHDAPAAAAVFDSGIPIDMVGLNVTRTCPIRRELFDEFENSPRRDIVQLMRTLIDFRSGEPMHDAIAISTLIDERLATWREGTVRVETQDVERRGQTVFREGSGGRHRVAVAVDTGRFEAVLRELLTRLH